MVITVCNLIEKFECTGKFTMCGNNVTRKYWLIADRPKNVALFRPCPDFMGGGMAPLPPSSYTPTQEPLFHKNATLPGGGGGGGGGGGSVQRAPTCRIMV